MFIYHYNRLDSEILPNILSLPYFMKEIGTS